MNKKQEGLRPLSRLDTLELLIRMEQLDAAETFLRVPQDIRDAHCNLKCDLFDFLYKGEPLYILPTKHYKYCNWVPLAHGTILQAEEIEKKLGRPGPEVEPVGVPRLHALHVLKMMEELSTAGDMSRLEPDHLTDHYSLKTDIMAFLLGTEAYYDVPDKYTKYLRWLPLQHIALLTQMIERGRDA